MRIKQIVLASALAVGKNATVYSSSLTMNEATGNVSVLVVSTAGEVTITQQCSLDDTTWYDPKDKRNAALGEVVSAMTVGSRFVAFGPCVAPYMRFKIVEGNVAASAVSITLSRQVG